MVSTRPPTTKSSSSFNNPLVNVPKAQITIGIIVTFMFQRFFFSILLKGRITYSFFHFPSDLFCGRPGQQSLQFCKFSFFFFFLLIIIRSDLLAEIRWSVYMPKSQRSFCVSFSRTDTGLCIYHLFLWSNLNFLQISQWISLPTQSCLVVYSF